MTWSFRLITKLFLIGSLALLLPMGCASDRDDPYDQIMHGTIAYPFAKTDPLGTNGPGDRFIIKSSVGGTEYAIEIPGAAQDFDVEVPLAAIHQDNGPNFANGAPTSLAASVNTDKELVNALPQLAKHRPTDTAVIDGVFGVGEAEGPQQSPSYSLGISKVNHYYKKKQFEYALIEINNMLAFYPNSPKLLKMKGTVLVKIRNFQLAELSWIKALQLTPQDKSLRKALERLQARMMKTGHASQGLSMDAPYSIPQPVGYGQNVQPEQVLTQ